MSHLSSQSAVAPAAARPAKAAHYSSALSAALLHGAWADGHAGKDAKGYEVSWGELVRKWGKHTGGNTALVHHLRDISLLYLSAHSTVQTSSSGYITVSTPPISSAQSPPNTSGSHPVDGQHSSTSSADAGDSSQSGSGSSFIHIPHPHLRRHKSKPSFDATRAATNASGPSIGGSTVRQAEKAAFLSASDLDGDEGEGEEYWAEGSGWWNGVGMDQVEEVRDGIRGSETALKSGKLSEAEAQSAHLLLAYHHHAIGDHQMALTILEGVQWSLEAAAGANGGEAATLERIRGRCLQGMSYELLDPASPAALQCYISTIALLGTAFPSPTPSYLSTSSSIPAVRLAFEPNRELHRWLATSLCRAAIISSRQPNAIRQTHQILRTYHNYAASWPSSFRPNQRHRMLLLYLSALAAGYPVDNVNADSPYLLSGGETSLSARAVWRKEAEVAIRDGQRLLAQTTSFPRAGAINKPVRSFTSLCVALADRSPVLTMAVIDILWWSMTLTFQSQSVLRHLTRLLHRKDQDTDARRTFELYVQSVLKSRQTAQPEASLSLRDDPSDEAPEVPEHDDSKEATTSISGEEAQGIDSQKTEAESDGDEEFVEALLVGVRIISRDLGELAEGWRYACLAREVVSRLPRGGQAKRLRAEVEEVLGIVRMAMATIAADPITRPKYQAQAINHLLTSCKLVPSSGEILYHLSYAQAEARSIDDATQSIHTSLELDSENVQAWHLLALLLTAKQDWEGARKACEAGIAIWEADEATDSATDEEDDEAPVPAVPELDASVESRDFATSPSRTTGPTTSSAAHSDPLLYPSGSLRPLAPAPPHKIPRSRRLHNVIRLRMTLNVITEKMQGAEVAMLRHQELFAFFSARSGEGRRQFGYGSGGMGTLPSMSTVGGLGGSYVSVLESDSPGDSVVNVHPPTPVPPQGYTLETPPRITHSTASSSRGYSTPEGDGTDDDNAGMETLTRDFAEKGSIQEKDGRTSGSRKGLAKHLHVSGVKGMGMGRPSSVRRTQDGSGSDLAQRDRTASASSVALSVAPTAKFSHYRGAGPNASSLRAPSAPPINASAPPHGRTPGESRILSSLWLMSAATFRRLGEMEQCLVAINEAEILDPENGDVWIQLGLYHSAGVPPNYPAAQSAYTKAVLLRPLHPAAIIHLSNLYLKTGQVDLAHSFLNQVTQDNGWDLPEAWLLLARACREQGREAREKECLMFALGLEETRGVRGWREAVDRWV